MLPAAFRIFVEFIHEFLQLTLHLIKVLPLIPRVRLVCLSDRLVCGLDWGH